MENIINEHRQVQKKKILVDLDVVTVAKWEKQDKRKEDAVKFLQRVEELRYYLYTPNIIMSLLSRWKNIELKNKIEDFYYRNTYEFISEERVVEECSRMGIDREKVLGELMKKGLKDEDAFLIFTASLFEIEFFITFNRKHLLRKKEDIAIILQKHNLKTIEIVEPGYFLANSSFFFSISLILFIAKVVRPFFISSANLIGSTFAGIRASLLFAINKQGFATIKSLSSLFNHQEVLTKLLLIIFKNKAQVFRESSMLKWVLENI